MDVRNGQTLLHILMRKDIVGMLAFFVELYIIQAALLVSIQLAETLFPILFLGVDGHHVK